MRAAHRELAAACRALTAVRWTRVAPAALAIALAMGATRASAGSCCSGGSAGSGHAGHSRGSCGSEAAAAEKPVDPAPPTIGRHGGAWATAGAYRFESVWKADGLRVYLHASDLSPMLIGDAAGLVLFRMLDGSLARVPLQMESPARGESPVVYFCTMHPDVVQPEAGYCRRCGMSLSPQDRLFARTDLAAAKAGSAATVTITGLEGQSDSLTFEQAFPGIATTASGDQASVSGEHHHAAP